MVTYNLDVGKQQIFGADRVAISADADKTVALKFSFDRCWRMFDSKAAIFKTMHGEYYIIEIILGRVKVPWEVMRRAGEVELSVVAFEDDRVLTAKPVKLRVVKSLLPHEFERLTSSETLFDRFRAESKQEAVEECKGDLQKIKDEYNAEIQRLSDMYDNSQAELKQLAKDKDEEIAEINRNNNNKIMLLTRKMNAVQNELDIALPKAENWELIDAAISKKLTSVNPLWGGGTEPFELPMLNTEAITRFNSNNFSDNIIRIGLDLSSASNFDRVFEVGSYLERVELRNTGGVLSFSETFNTCENLKAVKFGSLGSCTNIFAAFTDCVSVEEISFDDVLYPVTIQSAFSGCKALRAINGIIDLSRCGSMSDIFDKCYSLETVRFVPNSIRKDLNIGDSVKLTRESVLSIMEALNADYPATLSVSVNSLNNAFVTEEERVKAHEYITEEKGWQVIYC